jgi:ABC-type polysaccharide/polyol phosphate transport system ATPase subunit
MLLPISDPDPFADAPPAVRVENLRVRFRTTHEHHAPRGVGALFRRHSTTSRAVDALRGVSFEVPSGCVYGVIGNNGAGKSTLFRVLAGILPPTAGRVSVWGHVSPLLSLGLGMNRELTGRENILLGGLAHGLTREEIRRHHDAIVEFADLGDAIDYPMRTYSSGMNGRLAFAVAAHLEPEILLIDEALAAGDGAFKKKCMAKIIELCERDCTVMIVSHGLILVKLLADRCLWLERGEVRLEGEAGEVVDAYLEHEGLGGDAAAFEDL